MDVVQKEVVEFLSHILSGNIPQDVVSAGRMQLRVADEYESVSDYVTNILKLHMKLRNADIHLSEEGTNEILSLHDRAASYVQLVDEGVREGQSDILAQARSQGEVLTNEMKESRSNHLNRVEQGETKPLASFIFVDILNAYRRIKDHGLNIAEALAGEK